MKDGVSELGYHRRLDNAGYLEIDSSRREVVEQADTFAKDDGNQVDVDVVQQSGPEALLQSSRGAHFDVLVSGGHLRLTNGTLNPVCDKGERRFLPDQLVGNGMDKTKAPARRVEYRPRPGRPRSFSARMTIAPVALSCSSRSAALWRDTKSVGDPGMALSVSPLKYHLKGRSTSLFGPATKPSSDTLT